MPKQARFCARARVLRARACEWEGEEWERKKEGMIDTERWRTLGAVASSEGGRGRGRGGGGGGTRNAGTNLERTN